MAEVRVRVAGIESEGRHGANPGERDLPQRFLVDLDVVLRVEADDLDDTLDYRVAARAVREVVAATSFVLLESLAAAVARAVSELPGVLRATATVHKPAAADELGADDVSVEASASR